MLVAEIAELWNEASEVTNYSLSRHDNFGSKLAEKYWRSQKVKSIVKKRTYCQKLKVDTEKTERSADDKDKERSDREGGMMFLMLFCVI